MANNQQLLLGEGAGGGIPNYIEEVFSTYLYTGTGAAETITNGIDLSTKGGLAWVKSRSNTSNNILNWNASGGSSTDYAISSDTWGGSSGITDFLSTGFTVSTGYGTDGITLGRTYCTWTFRQQPKFFDIVTYTGTGSSTTIAHNLGSVPGCIIVKRVNVAGDWAVYHRSLANTEYLVLNTTAAKATGATWWNSTTPTSSVFSVGTDASVNASGGTYVAYLFAHDAGGFGLAGTDNVISCGSYTGAGSPYTGGSEINLGYEPQWVLIKSADNATNWVMIDNMRGWEAGTSGLQNWLYANTSGAENTGGSLAYITSTGFKPYGASLTNNTGTYIYIAIRRGPMKVPTVGTSVFSVDTYNQTSASDPAFNLGKVADMGFRRINDFVDSWILQSRLTGNFGLITNTTAAEATRTFGNWDNNVGWYQGAAITPPYSQANWYGWTFARAPGFFDVVCYTGTGSNTNFTHNLGAVPELMIVKARNGNANWAVYVSALGATKYLILEDSGGSGTLSTFWNNTAPTSTVFTLGTASGINGATTLGVAYLFATCAGVSKVGSYTGNGSSQTIACGFTAGSRFVMIKRTDSTGDWYVWDSARGIVAGNDPHLSLNTTAAEVTTDDSVDTDNSGFIVNQLSATNVNVSSASYIFLAVS